MSVYEAEAGEWKRELLSTERDFMFRREDEEFLRAITEGTQVSIPLSEAVKSQRIIQEATKDSI